MKKKLKEEILEFHNENREPLKKWCQSVANNRDKIGPIFDLIINCIGDDILQFKQEAEAFGLSPKLTQAMLIAYCESIIFNDYTKLNRLFKEAHESPEDSLNDMIVMSTIESAPDKIGFRKELLQILNSSEEKI